ncbi:MAG: NAD(P)/FAD-dependent oxidoreductase, partial [Chloroflexota bacterium]|nr:NAD(P)/FAD-dependent oxidoreductase [Chloroflexota bacterium]
EADVPGRRQVLILGGGWGGVYTALELEKRLRSGEGVDVTLISRENSFLFTPMLPEVAASAISMNGIVTPIRRLLQRTRFINAEVVAIDLERRRVRVELTEGTPRELRYDQLVLAMGAATNFFDLPGVREHAFNVRSLADAIDLRNHIIQRLEQADVVEGERQQRLVTFVLCGGGLNGVEVIGGLNDFVREAISAYARVPPGDVRVVLLEAMPRLLPEMDEGLAEFTRKTLEQRGVEVWLNARVASATPDSVHLADGRALPCGTIIWSAGVRPAGLVVELPLQRDRWNRLICDGTMRVAQHPEVWALGDVAHVPRPGGGPDDIYPPTAQHAVRAAQQLGKNIAAVLRGEEPQPFVYPLKIQLATIGHRSGVASIMGWHFSGLLPWWLWRTYYLARIPRLERQLRVTIDWTLDVFFPRDIVSIPVGNRHTARQAARLAAPRAEDSTPAAVAHGVAAE